MPFIKASPGRLRLGRIHDAASATDVSSSSSSSSSLMSSLQSVVITGTASLNALMCSTLVSLGHSKKGITGKRSWRRARGFAEWMSVSHDKQSAAASALQVTTAGACSQTAHIHTRSWREASLLAPCTLPSQPRQRYAASALQYTTALESWHASQRFGILQKNQFFSSPPKAPLRSDLPSTYCSTLPPLPPSRPWRPRRTLELDVCS